MNFQPTDYLANLNLEFDSPVVENQQNGYNIDLDLFSHNDFFDLDVFSNDTVAPSKQQQKLQYQQSLPQENVQVKQEEALESAQTSPVEDEEDVNAIKRKRNTAASARFRIKKKLKEKQMEQQSKELQERLGALEKKLRTLEMENRCLRQLVMEKNEKKNCDLLESIKRKSEVGSSFTYTTHP